MHDPFDHTGSHRHVGSFSQSDCVALSRRTSRGSYLHTLSLPLHMQVLDLSIVACRPGCSAQSTSTPQTPCDCAGVTSESQSQAWSSPAVLLVVGITAGSPVPSVTICVTRTYCPGSHSFCSAASSDSSSSMQVQEVVVCTGSVMKRSQLDSSVLVLRRSDSSKRRITTPNTVTSSSRSFSCPCQREDDRSTSASSLLSFFLPTPTSCTSRHRSLSTHHQQ